MKNELLISIISLILFTSCESQNKLTEYVKDQRKNLRG